MSYKNFIESKKDFLSQYFPSYMLDNQNKVACYSSWEEEYFILHNGVGLRDISYKSIYKLIGKDVLDFIHRISTNSIRNLSAFEKANTLFLNDKGKIIDRTMLLSYGDYYLLLGSEFHKNKLYRWLDRFIINEDIEIVDQNSNYSVFEILGPQTESYLTMICGRELDKLTNNNFINFSYEDVDFQLLKYSEPSGLIKYWLLSESKNYEEIIKIFLSQKSVFDFGLVGNEAYEVFRIENMIPKAPNELTDNFNPHDLNLVHEVDFSKGCYIGQEVIARQDTYNKIQFSLSKIVLEENIIPIPFELEENGQLICRISSLAKSPKYNKYVGLSLLRKSHFNGTQSFTLDVDGRELNCNLV
mgnify:CR=1 FL=1